MAKEGGPVTINIEPSPYFVAVVERLKRLQRTAAPSSAANSQAEAGNPRILREARAC